MKKRNITGTRKLARKSNRGRPRQALGDTTDFWKRLISGRPKPKAKAKRKPVTRKLKPVTLKPRKRAKHMATKKEEKKEQEQETVETLPPPDPPVVKSEPTEPPAPDAVIEQEQVGAQPEDAGAVRELDLIPDSVYARGEGPKPEEREKEETDKGKKEKKAKKEEE